MSISRRTFLVTAAAFCLARPALAVPYSTPIQANQTWRGQWHDIKRDRDVPVKIYYPEGKGPFPIILFSHGLGGSRDGYQYLGDYWSRHGYISVHLQHIGSDDSVWKNGGGIAALKTAMTPQNAFNRARDISFVIDQLTLSNMDQNWPLKGKLDLDRIGMAGHSFGANTTLMASGLRMAALSLGDPRIKCAIAMSSPPPFTKNYDALYGGIRIPMLHMTGTKDVSEVDNRGFDPVQRRIPFDHIINADGYLLTFKDGDHMVFSGQRRGPAVATDDRYHALIQQTTTAFWDAYLKGDGKAVTWLRDDFSKELGTSGVFEQKVLKGS